MSVTPSQFGLLSSLMDAASLRHQAIAQNVANVNTPGYRRIDVAFEEALVHQIHGGQTPETLPEPRIVPGASKVQREDGNNVDIDAEMGRLNKNTMLFNVYSQILASRMATMRSAIAGR